ncbi:hypothetical protein BDV28DRAFT_135603 [Aspergillus coremiiformis]|uniref:Uncharacterized protein n=1 Tax=Aspergillus coremiiformis TaxID=138285 RepID=A0A5N6Z3E6_9EURO|nr:hypothetical protein BDV28DRAFT_135603 [Aspergillus coremiiformis]
MSAALPWLQKLRKPQLTDWAEATDLHDYEELNKPELAAALDEHLQANESIFVSDARLAEYYRRLSQTPRKGSPVKGSPVKREPKVEVTPLAPRSARRRQTRTKEESPQYDEEDVKEQIEPTDESDTSPPPTFQTPGPSPLNFPRSLPASPAVVTDAIETGTTAFCQSLGNRWAESGVLENTYAVRSMLSSAKAVQILLLVLEGGCIIHETLPLRFVTTLSLWTDPLVEISVKVPDIFILLDGAFWAPFSLWLLTSVVLPLTVAYFFNISLKIAQGGASTRGSSRDAQAIFDPLSFNIAKAGFAYLVYAKQFDFFDVYSQFSIARVNAAVPGQWAGLVTGSVIGVIGTLYEAILRQ